MDLIESKIINIVNDNPVKVPPFDSLLNNSVNPNTVQTCPEQYSQTIQTSTDQYNNNPITVFEINDSQNEVSTEAMPKLLNIHSSTFDNITTKGTAGIHTLGKYRFPRLDREEPEVAKVVIQPIKSLQFVKY